jgi:transposase
LEPDTLKPDSGLGEGCPGARPSKYSEDFRRDAVDLVRSSGRTIRDAGRELGVNHETLRNWVSAAKRADEQRSGGTSAELSGAERDELRRLRRKSVFERVLIRSR